MIKKILNGSINSVVLLLFGFIAVIAMIHFSGIQQYISLENLQAHSQAMKQGVEQNYFKSVMYYLFVYTALISIPPLVVPLTLFGGFLFGLIPGFLLSLLAATVGSTLAFLALRYFLGSLLRNSYQAELEKFDQKIKNNGSSYLLTLQLLSIIPYPVTDILAALTGISLFTFVWTFAVGNIPLIFILTFMGQNLASIHSVHDIFSAKLLLALGFLALIALIPMILRRFNIKL